MIAIEEEIVAGEKSRGPQLVQVVWMQLVGGEHQTDHLVVRHVGVQRLDNPIAPVPDVVLAVSQLVAQSPPVAVAPDVHPVAGPTLAMPRIIEQSLHEWLIPVLRGHRH